MVKLMNNDGDNMVFQHTRHTPLVTPTRETMDIIEAEEEAAKERGEEYEPPRALWEKGTVKKKKK